jgi:hypothetical protein
VAPASATASATLAGDPLEGIWQTAPISPAEAEATLRQHDLEKYIQQFGNVTPVSEEMVLILDIHDGEWDLYGKPKGGARQEIDATTPTTRSMETRSPWPTSRERTRSGGP